MKNFAFSLMTIVIAAFLCSEVLALPKDDLVLHFAFDGGSAVGDTAKDISGNGNDATINGGAKVIADGLEFDGIDGYVSTAPLNARTGGNDTFTDEKLVNEYIRLESESLSKLKQSMENGDKNLIIKSAAGIRPNFVKLFFLFGDFESTK